MIGSQISFVAAPSLNLHFQCKIGWTLAFCYALILFVSFHCLVVVITTRNHCASSHHSSMPTLGSYILLEPLHLVKALDMVPVMMRITSFAFKHFLAP